MSPSQILGSLAAVAVLAGCAATPNASVHESIAGKTEQRMPRKMLLLPADIRVHEISAGGVVEKVDDWTISASNHAMKSVREIAGSKSLFEPKEVPALAEAEKHVLEQHLALYELVAASADLSKSGPFAPWRERAKTFDYTLGPGLRELAERSDLDAAVVVIGSDYISSGGRKATMALGILAAALTGVAVIPVGGTAYVSVGVVDLRSGNLLWFATNRGQTDDLRQEQQVRAVLDKLFTDYPGATPAKAANAGK
ncbi:MAG TPA: hypothetical protein VJT81_01180 [Burkholderiales bacterium]|nr:hypothetical protein [Burkholderiales bacterium]